MKKIIVPLLSMVALLVLGSCDKDKSETVMGMKPVYASAADIERVDVRTSEPLNNPGKIYVYQNYLLVNDHAKGIHIYDNTNPNAPVEVSFISIPGNKDFSVRNNTLYADNITDMVIFDISQPAQPVYKSRMKSVFPTQVFPDQAGKFECVDPSKGIVLRWEKAQLVNPGCSK